MSEDRTHQQMKKADDRMPRLSGQETITYCDACFLAFGSQERRVVNGSFAYHPDCAARKKGGVS